MEERKKKKKMIFISQKIKSFLSKRPDRFGISV